MHIRARAALLSLAAPSLAVLLSTSSGGARLAAQETVPEPDASAPAALLAAFDATAGAEFRGAALVGSHGAELLAVGRGAAGEGGDPMTVDTVVDVGSVSKSFTAAGVLRLQMAGRLALSDPLSRFVPDVPADKRGITLLHLITHTSGIAADLDLSSALGSRDTLLAAVLAAPLKTQPGEAFEYANPNYFVLAAVIELASGGSFEDWMAAQVFAPAGLRDTGLVGAPPAARERFARRRASAADRPVDTELDAYPWNWAQRGATGVQTTPRDLLRWHAACSSGPFLDAPARALQRTPVLAGYACGWSVHRDGARGLVLEHGGATGGFRAVLISVPAADLVVVVTCGADDDPEPVARALFAIVGGAPAAGRASAPRGQEAAERAEPDVRGNLILDVSEGGAGERLVRSLQMWRVYAHDGFLYGFAFDRERLSDRAPVVDLYLPDAAAAVLAQALDAAAAQHEGDGGDAASLQATFTSASAEERSRARDRSSAIAWRKLPAPLQVTVRPPAADGIVRADLVLANGDVAVELSLAPAAAREWARRLREPKRR